MPAKLGFSWDAIVVHVFSGSLTLTTDDFFD